MDVYRALRQKLGFTGDLPHTKDWSAAADFLELIADYCLTNQPNIILECSSGLSTLILARCCKINQHGKVISLENGADYAASTRKNLSQYGLADYATVIDSPLHTVQANSNDYQWYQIDSHVIPEIDLLVIDGPNGYIQKNSRYPALPVLHSLFAERCAVFLDDAAREDEQEIVTQWRQQYQPTSFEYIEMERGCAVFRF
ncbi:hypothetical protein MNBD_GAMMA23-2284 [hydrothermal vent metagenome]|uniref:Class I SAM-dependent methyltransferase n=1 Tax=hydrothermal vent metagenome TaxID=652676 RepID=A0A3B0ZS41_9ZZZZ